MSLRITVDNQPDKSYLSLEGELKYDSLDKLQAQLLESLNHKALELDVRKVKKLNFSFVQMFFSLLKTIEAKSIPFKVLYHKDNSFYSVMNRYGAEWYKLEPYCREFEGTSHE